MKLTFLGAAHEVTGSCTLVEACGKRFLVDAGMEQGKDVYENAPLPLLPGDIDFILLTHAHIDHAGRIPYLSKCGFRGDIHCTNATQDLCNIMLMDSAHIQEFEAEWKNRKNKRSGDGPIEPLYTLEDAAKSLQQFQGHSYQEPFSPCEGITVSFSDVGHLLGSASIRLEIVENGEKTVILFSGDIGNTDQPIIKDPCARETADYVVMESTYGDRLHGPKPDYIAELTRILQETFDKGGNVVVPCFAVGRTQEMLYFLREIKQKNLVKHHPDFEVYLDSPLAVEATKIFLHGNEDCYDEEAMALIREGVNPLTFPGLKLTTTSDESRALNFDMKPKVILSASGMCEAGRIRHHLKHNLWRPESTILFVGYQAVGTLGRSLVEGDLSEVRLFGETITVRARIEQLTGMSGHADQHGLDAWLTSSPFKPKAVFVNHGDDEVVDKYAARLGGMGYNSIAPYNGARYELTADHVECLEIGNRTRIVRETGHDAPFRQSAAYLRLVEMGKRLMTVITHNQGGSNKDLARFASQIASLCDKWDR